ncbi:hypothetical protein D0T60_18725, partial [Bacteroides sp. 224]|nr:hypothetical protein [Bacteroides sp. 224]
DYGVDSKEYRDIIMELIPRYYPNDPVANSNAAALLIRNKEYQSARRLLERAGNLASAWNNLGVVNLALEEYEQAATYLKQAASAGVQEAAHNQEELNKKLEDIEKQAKRNRQ